MIITNTNGNICQFGLIRFINENSDDEHILTKISIVLRRDKIEAPYYMITKIKVSTCIDAEPNGLIHAMDVLNHHRRYNLTREVYEKIEELILKSEDDITKNDNQLKLVLFTRGKDENKNLFDKYQELFDLIDSLIEVS